jgi:hypothetical protein
LELVLIPQIKRNWCGVILVELLCSCLQLSLYDTWRNVVREAHTILMSLSVHPSVWNMKTRRIFTWELKLGCPRGVFCPSSIPSEYLFLCARRKFGFNEKKCTKLLIVYMYFQPNSCNTHAERERARGTFLRHWGKVPPAHAQRVSSLPGGTN